MPLKIDVSSYCVFKGTEKKLANGHNDHRCPQCQALRRIVIMVNNGTLDMILDVLGKTNPELRWSPADLIKQINGLKTV